MNVWPKENKTKPIQISKSLRKRTFDKSSNSCSRFKDWLAFLGSLIVYNKNHGCIGNSTIGAFTEK